MFRQIDVGQFAAVAGVDERARAGGRPAHRRRVERRRLRGPRRADVAALDACQLPREADLVAHGQLRHARWAVRALEHRQPRRLGLERQGLAHARARSPAPASSPVWCPCNVIAEEILTDHPDRYRAMLVESGNPAHSLADSQRMREALLALDLLVVIDVVDDRDGPPRPLRAARGVAVREVGGHVLQLRLPGATSSTSAARSSSRCRARSASRRSMPACARRWAPSPRPTSRRCVRRRERSRAAFADGVLRCGGARSRARSPARRCCSTARSGRRCRTTPQRRPSCGERRTGARSPTPESVARAGFGTGLEAGEALFDAILASPSGLVFSRRRAGGRPGRGCATDDGKVHLAIDELLAELDGLSTETPPGGDPRLPVRAVRRRAPVVHRQHDLPRSVVAQA